MIVFLMRVIIKSVEAETIDSTYIRLAIASIVNLAISSKYRIYSAGQ